MNIKMAGIDHSKAGVEAREAFSFTKSAAEGAMKQVREMLDSMFAEGDL